MRLLLWLPLRAGPRGPEPTRAAPKQGPQRRGRSSALRSVWLARESPFVYGQAGSRGSASAMWGDYVKVGQRMAPVGPLCKEDLSIAHDQFGYMTEEQFVEEMRKASSPVRKQVEAVRAVTEGGAIPLNRSEVLERTRSGIDISTTRQPTRRSSRRSRACPRSEGSSRFRSRMAPGPRRSRFSSTTLRSLSPKEDVSGGFGPARWSRRCATGCLSTPAATQSKARSTCVGPAGGLQ